MTPSKETVNVAVRVEIGDLELVARHREGDLDAFGEIYRRHAGRLYSLAYRMVGNAGDAGRRGGADGQPPRSRAGDCRAAGGVPGGVSAPRRGGLRAPRGGRDAPHRGGDGGVTGGQ